MCLDGDGCGSMGVYCNRDDDVRVERPYSSTE
jgi:hypothetical protein